MRANLMVSVLGCALAGAITASTAAMADWHSPYFYRETNGSWTNVTYDDGICRYRYSHNTYDNQTYLNKYGDCSRIAVGPDGLATPNNRFATMFPSSCPGFQASRIAGT